MAKLREVEILGYILEKKSVTASQLARDLQMSLQLAARWLGNLHKKGWLSKKVLAPHKGRFYYQLSPQAENTLDKVRSRHDTWRNLAWLGLGALLVMALSRSGSSDRDENGEGQ